MTNTPITIRRADVNDVTTLARFAVELANLHVSFDRRRFVAPEGGEAAFTSFFKGELARPEAVLLIAEIANAAIGYAFVRMEPRSFEDLRGSGAWLQDIFVAPDARSHGAGRRLVEAALEAARSLGSTSLMLDVSPRNAKGRSLFDSVGFRATMIEMRIEINE
jgi:GNAT superfamily N-acetyltransferase